MNKYIRLNNCVIPKEDFKAAGIDVDCQFIAVHYKYDDNPIKLYIRDLSHGNDILNDIHLQLEET